MKFKVGDFAVTIETDYMPTNANKIVKIIENDYLSYDYQVEFLRSGITDYYNDKELRKLTPLEKLL